ncbi:MAG: calcium-binding EGF-like domain-containing protein [Flavobacteriales bacterium]
MKQFHLALVLALSTITVLSSCKKDDPCDNVTCQNGGTCNDGSCACATGYEGTTCGTEIRAKFIGTYNGNFSCPGNNSTVNMTINNSAQGITSVVFSDGFDTWVGTVSGSSVTIATQTISGGTTISGSGQLAGNILTLNLNLSGTTCTYSGTKQ